MNNSSKRGVDFTQALQARGGWYHSFELPDGTRIEGYNSLEHLRYRYSHFPIPKDLTGRRVLDIGAWDGWFSFEAERNGAQVVAMDCVEIANLLEVRWKLDSKVDYRILDFYEMPQAGLGVFDIIFFLGVLYHLKHPFLALEIVCAMTTQTAIVDSFVIDGNDWKEHANDVPYMEFYEVDELGSQLDNWNGPTVSCLLAMCRAAGFARVELLDIQFSHASVACHRHWEPIPAKDLTPAPEMIVAAHARNYGLNFNSRREEYVAVWFRTERPAVARGDLRMEIGPFGVPALFVKKEDGGRWMANFRLPPGITPGWHDARLRFADSTFSSASRIAVDMAPHATELTVRAVYDGHSWAEGVIQHVRPEDGYPAICSFWILGLSDNCDRHNVAVFLGDRRIPVDWIGNEEHDRYRQVNAVVPADVPAGPDVFRVEFAGVTSARLPVTVQGI